MANLKPSPVRFTDSRRRTTQFRRVETEDVYLRRESRYLYVVRVGDGRNATVLLARDDGRWEGGCDCPRWFFTGHRDGSPCVHLWAVKRAAETDDEFHLHHADDGIGDDPECPRCGQERPHLSEQVEVIRGP